MEKAESPIIVRYQCVSGYMEEEEGTYEIGEEIKGIGPVQYIEKIEEED